MKYSTWLKIIDVKSAGWKMLEYWSKTATLKWAISSAYQHLWCLVSSLGDHSQIITTFAIPPAITSYCSHSNYSHHHPSPNIPCIAPAFLHCQAYLISWFETWESNLRFQRRETEGRKKGRRKTVVQTEITKDCQLSWSVFLDPRVLTTFYPGGWKRILFGR